MGRPEDKIDASRECEARSGTSGVKGIELRFGLRARGASHSLAGILETRNPNHSPMLIHYVSDLHLEFWNPFHQKMIDSIPSDIADVLILAGDILTFKAFTDDEIGEIFADFAKKAKHVLYVRGNHEHYGQPIKRTQWMIDNVVAEHVNVLERKVVKIDGQRFLGATLWFPLQPQNDLHERCVADFSHIEPHAKHAFRNWVYDEHDRDRAFLEENIHAGDVVVTHHLPSMSSVPLMYKNTETNRFFVAPCEDLIFQRKPKAWIHGHTHSVCDYVLDKTTILCNPAGYPASPHTGYAGERTAWNRGAIFKLPIEEVAAKL